MSRLHKASVALILATAVTTFAAADAFAGKVKIAVATNFAMAARDIGQASRQQLLITQSSALDQLDSSMHRSHKPRPSIYSLRPIRRGRIGD